MHPPERRTGKGVKENGQNTFPLLGDAPNENRGKKKDGRIKEGGETKRHKRSLP